MHSNRHRSFAGRRPGPGALVIFLFLSLFTLRAFSQALPQKLGDLDADGRATVFDLVRLVNHINGTTLLSTNLVPFADINQDGYVNDLDVSFLADAILGFRSLPLLPLTTVRQTSPANNESGVAVIRETILYFSAPLSVSAVIGTNQLYAVSGGRRLLTRIELSTDRHKASLFYLEPLPGSSRVNVTFVGDGIMDYLGRQIDPDGDGVPGGSITINFDTLSDTGVATASVFGRVFASQLMGTNSLNVPLAGVTITVDGKEDTLRTVTDVNGNFILSNAPVGQFFVLIDGRTATNNVPLGGYYPYVGKAWLGVAGQSLPAEGTGQIYLPLIAAGTLQAVSTVTNTTITFPSSVLQANPNLQGVQIQVPANSLFSDNGTRGGMVGIAPVDPNRLPEPLPPGLNLPLVITVQTDGPRNFDRPVPVRFPNLPDPLTGVKLPPGAKSALWSFNHDTGRFEIVGPMTVTADGLYVETDPGVGILAPGWHGTYPGVRGIGTRIINFFKDLTKCFPAPSGFPCPPSMAVPVNFSSWTETANPTNGNITSPKGFGVDAYLCYDADTQCWMTRVTGMKSFGNINLTLANYNGTTKTFDPPSQEPNPVDGGNVTADNYCAIIAEMAGYLGRGRGDWHLLAASRAHEYNHRDVELKGAIEPIWQTIQMQMESKCIPCDRPKAEAAATLSKFIDDTKARMMQKFLEKWGDHADHDRLMNDGPYIAGQAVLNAKIADIKTYAQMKGFAPCPSNAPQSLFTKTSVTPPYLVGLRATISNPLIDPGTSAQITVQTTYSDGSVMDETPGASGTTYDVIHGNIIVSANGVVTALAPGGAAIAIHHTVALDSLPKFTMLMFTVKSPLDSDNDGMPDAWEIAHGLNPNDPSDADQDRDGDGLTNLQEYQLGTDPNNPDTDGDGVSDGQEVINGTNPLNPKDFVPPPLVSGLHYFAILNVDTGDVVQRGVTGKNGIAFDNLILAAKTHYRVFILDAATFNLGSAEFTTPQAGATIQLPAVALHASMAADSDNDGLPDDAEFLAGTDPHNPDTGSTGILDGAKVQQGLLGTGAQATGIIASSPTPGTAMDICAVNDMAVVAELTQCVSIFNIFSSLAPTLIAQVQTPGSANAVACSGQLVAVACGAAGLAVIDLSAPTTPQIVQQVNLGSSAQCVAVAANVAYVGLASGQLVSVDMQTGVVLDLVNLGGPVQDIGLVNGTVYALTDTKLFALQSQTGYLIVAASVASPGIVPIPRSRLFVGEGLAYASNAHGYNIFDISNPVLPVFVTTINTTQLGWKQIVANGTGIGVAAVGNNRSDDGNHDISIYNLGANGTSNQFITTFTMPGIASAVAIYNGIAYVADGAAGLQVVNYLSAQNQGAPPTISLSTGFTNNVAAAGKVVTITAAVTDGSQVRNVEFYIDGVKVATVGSYPFQYSFLTPLLSSNKTSFTLQARTTDTVGLSTFSQLITVNLIPDPTPPQVHRVFPAPRGISGSLNYISAYLTKPIDTNTLVGSAFTLVAAGPDGVFGTADDIVITNGVLGFRSSINVIFMTFPTNLPAGWYRAMVGPPIADLAGHPVPAPYRWTFWAISQQDSDHDGVPDDVEIKLGLNPFSSDSLGDGISDGDRDYDHDGLSNAAEIIMGTDPANPHSVNPNILDGDLDRDGDALSDGKEFLNGTNPFVKDSDGDGWNDEQEVTAGSDPLDPLSTPKLLFTAEPPVSIVLPGPGPGTGGGVGLSVGTFLAYPPVGVVIPGVAGSGKLGLGTTVANPPVGVVLPSVTSGQNTLGVTVANPPVGVVVPGPGTAPEAQLGTTVANPPVKVQYGP